MIKACKECGIEKPATETHFYRLSNRPWLENKCKECRKKSVTKKRSALHRKRYDKDYMATFWRENGPKPFYKIKRAIGSRMRRSLRGKKEWSRWQDMLGYSVDDLKRHIERQFKPGMTWDNHGTVWHIDHIVPLSAFKITSVDDPALKVCWGLPNLRPLWANENLKKGGKRTNLL